MSDYESILSAASQLPIVDRLRLIDDLASSVPDDRPPTLSSEWLAEIERRSAEVDADSVKLDSWSDVRSRAFGEHEVDRAD